MGNCKPANGELNKREAAIPPAVARAAAAAATGAPEQPDFDEPAPGESGVFAANAVATAATAAAAAADDEEAPKGREFGVDEFTLRECCK